MGERVRHGPSLFWVNPCEAAQKRGLWTWWSDYRFKDPIRKNVFWACKQGEVTSEGASKFPVKIKWRNRDPRLDFGLL